MTGHEYYMMLNICAAALHIHCSSGLETHLLWRRFCCGVKSCAHPQQHMHVKLHTATDLRQHALILIGTDITRNSPSMLNCNASVSQLKQYKAHMRSPLRLLRHAVQRLTIPKPLDSESSSMKGFSVQCNDARFWEAPPTSLLSA